MKTPHFLAAGLILVLGIGMFAQSAFGYTFSRDLTVGSQGTDVAELQALLVTRGLLTFPAGIAPGYFGELTRQALVLFQASERITPAAGYFGPLTRSVANNASSAGTIVDEDEDDYVEDDGDWNDWFDADPWDDDYEYDMDDDEDEGSEDEDEDIEPLSIECIPSTDTMKAGSVVQFDVEVEGGVAPYSFQWSYGFNSYYAEPQVRFDVPGLYAPTVEIYDSYGTRAFDYCPVVKVTAASANSIAVDDDDADEDEDEDEDDDKDSDADNDAADGCYVGGCSRELCTDQPNRVSGCYWTESYACYPSATCERQSSGQCGWTMDDELEQCIDDAS